MGGRVAVVGLGIMGRPMAANLHAGGFEVCGYGRSEGSRARAEEVGVPVTGSLEEALDGADTVLTVLPDGPDVWDVLVGQQVLDHLPDGALVLDMSTIAPKTAREVHTAAAERGLLSLDAPVSGGEAAAVEGTLSVMAGGSPQAFDRARPFLECVGATVVHVGDAGSGQVVKAANQLLVAGHLQLLSEALVLLEAHGTDTGPALSVIARGLAGSTVIDRKGESMRARSYDPGFRLTLHRKDLGIVTDAASASGLALPLTAAAAQLVNALVARGDGDLDHTALYKLTRELNGLHA